MLITSLGGLARGALSSERLGRSDDGAVILANLGTSSRAFDRQLQFFANAIVAFLGERTL